MAATAIDLGTSAAAPGDARPVVDLDDGPTDDPLERIRAAVLDLRKTLGKPDTELAGRRVESFKRALSTGGAGQ